MAPAAGAFARLFMRTERPEPILPARILDETPGFYATLVVHFFTESEMCATLMREFTLVAPSGV
jgi:hypothetical protein